MCQTTHYPHHIALCETPFVHVPYIPDEHIPNLSQEDIKVLFPDGLEYRQLVLWNSMGIVDDLPSGT